jgi:hypothetical protein
MTGLFCVPFWMLVTVEALKRHHASVFDSR